VSPRLQASCDWSAVRGHVFKSLGLKQPDCQEKKH
jgi:hypothetical protein